VLEPIAKAFAESLVTFDVSEAIAWSPDVIVVADRSLLPRLRDYCDHRNVILIGLRHGAVNKYTAPGSEYKLADYICGSEWDVEDFESHGVYPQRGFLVTGNPWVDDVFRIPQRRLVKDSPTILFAPTYNPETSAAAFFHRRLLDLIRCVYPESRVIIKPHPAILEYNSPYVRCYSHIFVDWIEYWREIGKESGVEFIADSEIPISHFYDEADILISDGSSVIFEFMVLDRPILLYTSGKEIPIWENDPRAPGNAWRDVGSEFSTEDEFITCLRDAFSNHEKLCSPKQRKYTEELYGQFRDGCSVNRVVEAINSLPYLDVVLFVPHSDPLYDHHASRLKEAVSNVRISLVNCSKDSPIAELRKFASSANTEYVMPVIFDPTVEIGSASFITQAMQRLAKDSTIAVAGRGSDLNYSIVRAEILRSAENLSDYDEFLQFLVKQGYKVVSTIDDVPYVYYEKGFYAEEDGGRWMIDEGILRVCKALENKENSSTRVVKFNLTCGDAKCYRQFPFKVCISTEDSSAVEVEVRFDRSFQTVPVEVKTKKGRLILRSEQSFIPAEVGINGDPRLLSVHLTNVSVTEVSSEEKPVRLIAFYLPQYHRIPENDEWWGEGFTEWTNVRKGKPLFEGHYQPHEPGELGYYNLLDPRTREAQANLARMYGIEGFCYWHYWFNGKLLLERPLEEVIESGKPNFPFCIAWANESWTRSWDGRSDEILIAQEYGGEADDIKHFQYLLRAFRDSRYIKVDGKPLFLIYRPGDLPDPPGMVARWRKLARESGLKDLYLVAIRTCFDSTPENHWLHQGFDAELYFQPAFQHLWDEFGAGRLWGIMLEVSDGEPGLVIDYREAWRLMSELGKECYYHTVIPSWDNSPRKSSPFVLTNSSPSEYECWLSLECQQVLDRPSDERIVFINAWNEWGEGNHLEPDKKFGRSYLQATRRALVSTNAYLLYKHRKLDEAIAELREFLSKDPKYARGYNDLGVLCYEKGDLDGAIECLQKSAELDPKDVDCWRNLADAYVAKREYEKAKHACQQVLELVPDDAEAKSLAEYINKLLLEDIRFEGPCVSIIIPVFNNLHLTQNCFQSILANTDYPNYEIIFVDNASTDGTAEWLKSIESPCVKCIYNSENVGFVRACNTGANHASGDYLLFLNNDTVVKEGWLKPLVEFAEKTPDCGAVGAKLVYPNGVLQEAGGIIFSNGEGWNYGRGLNPDDPKFNFVREVDYCSGAALMVRRSVWEAIGGFDDRYSPAYYEDTDLCFGIRQLGYKVYYQPRSVVIHYEGQTAGRNLSSGVKSYQLRNKNKFVQKWADVLRFQPSYEVENIVYASDRSAKRSILVIDAFLPMFDRSSGSLRLYNLLKILKELNFHVTFLARNGSLEAKYRPYLEDLGIEVYTWDRKAIEAAEGYAGNVPSIDYAKLLAERKYDYALIEFWSVAEYYLPIIRKFSPETKIIVDTVDIHYIREMREAEIKGDRNLLVLAEAKKCRELAVYRQADRIWVVTDEDRKAIYELVEGIPTDVVPNVHKTVKEVKSFESTSDLLFVGNFSHPPNIDAVVYFCREIFPLITQKLKGVKLFIVGNNPPPEILSLRSEQIIVTGYVEDLSPYLRDSRVSVVPLRYGAGMKGKIGEALSWGLPVVTTSIGAEGMDLVNGDHVLIADDAESFANSVVRLYTDRLLWERLSSLGRAKVNEWSPEVVKNKLAKIFSDDSPLDERNLVSIIVLTHNQLEYTKKCFDSIAKFTPEPYELIVVDNASTDGTVEYIKGWKESHPNCKVVFNSENRGFAAGINQGILLAEGNFILLLNNDTVVTPGWLGKMLRCINEAPNIGIVGPMTNEISGVQKVSEVGYDVASLQGLEDFAEEWALAHNGERMSVWRVVGFCMLIKRCVIDKIGGFDCGYGLGNFEDDDFCIRANLAGFSCVIAKDCFIHHFGSRTFVGGKIDRHKLLLQNWETFKNKWGLPSELEYGVPYDLTGVLTGVFDAKKHYCPLESLSTTKWFVAPAWSQIETWHTVLEEYVKLHRPGQGSVLVMYAGPRADCSPAEAFQMIRDALDNLGMAMDNCPDIEITNRMIVDPETTIILTGSKLDAELQKRFPGNPTKMLRKPVAA
jgi:GT2 family glycosyltransferase/CDP-glycerol glycerophosphotransferase (TagB/SpsB family)